MDHEALCLSLLKESGRTFAAAENALISAGSGTAAADTECQCGGFAGAQGEFRKGGNHTAVADVLIEKYLARHVIGGENRVQHRAGAAGNYTDYPDFSTQTGSFFTGGIAETGKTAEHFCLFVLRIDREKEEVFQFVAAHLEGVFAVNMQAAAFGRADSIKAGNQSAFTCTVVAQQPYHFATFSGETYIF